MNDAVGVEELQAFGDVEAEHGDLRGRVAHVELFEAADFGAQRARVARHVQADVGGRFFVVQISDNVAVGRQAFQQRDFLEKALRHRGVGQKARRFDQLFDGALPAVDVARIDSGITSSCLGQLLRHHHVLEAKRQNLHTIF